MADVELLPCPFCGSAPRFDSGHGDAVCVLCGECGASSDFWNAGHEAAAASAWNTRANLAPLQAESARLREEVELWRHKAAVHQYRRKRLAEALRDARRALAFAAQHLPECNEPYERANAALAQEDRNV